MSVGRSRARPFLILSALLILAGLALGAVMTSSSSIHTTTASSATKTSSAGSSYSTTTTSSNTAETVGSSFANHLQLIDSQTGSAILTEYDSHPSETWEGEAQGLEGNYTGARNISLLFEAFFSNTPGPFTVTNESYRMTAINESAVIVNSTLFFDGDSSYFGTYNGTISVQDLFTHSTAGNTWLISNETFNFLRFNYPCIGGFCGFFITPSDPQEIQEMSVSADGNYLAAASMVPAGYNGSIFLVSLQNQTQLWRYITDTAVSSVAISSNGSYVAAGGYGYGPKHDYGEAFFLNREGEALWNVSTANKVVGVAMAANASRIAVDYSSGILFLSSAGNVLWNYTFPQGGTSEDFAMSSDARFMVYEDENISLPNTSGPGWGVFYVDSQGHQLWNYTKGLGSDNAGGRGFVQISTDGSRVAAAYGSYVNASTPFNPASGLVGNYRGALYYFDGTTGALLWQSPLFPLGGSLVMSSDGSHVATGGVGSLNFFFDSNGTVLWEELDYEPISVLQSDSLVLTFDGEGALYAQANLIAYNGTQIATFRLDQSTFGMAASPDGNLWVAASGFITGKTTCSDLRVFDGLSQVNGLEAC